MEFPDNQNPNRLAILAAGCVGAFLLPFAVRFGHVPTILVSSAFAIFYLVHTYWIISRNCRTNQTWIYENEIYEISCREARQKLETSDPTELKIVLKYESWPLNFSHLKPRAMLVNHTGNRYWMRWRFTPQIFQLLSIARRRGIGIEDVSNIQWHTKQSDCAG